MKVEYHFSIKLQRRKLFSNPQQLIKLKKFRRVTNNKLAWFIYVIIAAILETSEAMEKIETDSEQET